MRLTKYDDKKGQYIVEDKYIKFINMKLGRLEDGEEELKCDLDVLLKASKQGQIYVKKFNKYVDIRNIVIYEQATRPYIEYYYREYGQMTKVKEVWIDEYKQTWWLKSSKEE